MDPEGGVYGQMHSRTGSHVGRRAVVTPRGTSATVPEALDIEDLVTLLLEEFDGVAIVGTPGSGRTTALRHLAATRPDLIVLDRPDKIREDVVDVVYVNHAALRPRDAVVRLDPWSQDDAIEYLLARHPERCRSVMTRLLAAPDLELLGGCPDLWRAVLVVLAREPAVVDVATAIRRLLGRGSLERLVRHESVRAIRKADEVIADPSLLANHWRENVIREVARNESAVRAARKLIDARARRSQAMAASVLHASALRSGEAGWRPTNGRWWLGLGHFKGASWRELDLTQSHLWRANLDDADLTAATLDDIVALEASLPRARLRDASLQRAVFAMAELEDADLVRVRADEASFQGARLRGANLAEAELRNASFDGADLVNAVLAGARLERAQLASARVKGADFRGACLDLCNLTGVRLRAALLTGATFRGATLDGVDLERVRLEDADFTGAWFADALLTESSLPRARLAGASFEGARLAGISWPEADLRAAKFARAQFHRGSARSGLIDSVISSEGSRTGYYTDESRERHFKRPEEIRTANLRGADLRDAFVFEADFYMVDLRGALYSSEQAAHFASCGAILDGSAP